MTQTQWSAVDDYIIQHLLPHDATLEAALQASTQAGLPAINVAPPQGKLLMLLAQSMQARHILEVGTLGGYSTIWLARALPADGRLITLELDAHHAQVARQNLANAGLQDKVTVRVGTALETLQQMADEGLPPFDLVFIDADKESNAAYFDWALRFARVGTLIIVDNVVRDGGVVHADSTDTRIQGVRRLMQRIHTEPRVQATAIQTVGSKGYDGFVMALVTA